MELHQFDLNLLVALDALLTERNVTRAGKRLNLSQSAMSGALARLRDHFQDALLVPVGRRMVLTSLGEELAEQVRRILVDVKATVGATPRFHPATAGRHFSIAANDYAVAVLCAIALREAKRRAPHITIELRPAARLSTEELEAGDLDLLVAPAAFISAAHPSETLFEDTYTCVAWSENTSIATTMSLDEYLARGHVMVYSGATPTSLTWDEEALRRLNYHRRAEVWTPTFSSAPELVVGTERIATMPTRLAIKYAQLFPLKLFRVPIEIPPVVMVVQWHTVHDGDSAHRWFRALLKEVVASLPPARLEAQEARRRQPGASRPARHRSAPIH